MTKKFQFQKPKTSKLKSNGQKGRDKSQKKPKKFARHHRNLLNTNNLKANCYQKLEISQKIWIEKSVARKVKIILKIRMN